VSDALVGHLSCHLQGSVLMDERTEQLELARDVSAPRAARVFVSRTLAEWGHGAKAIERFKLLVSELVSNAVLHGSGAIEISVIERDYSDDGAGLVRIEVRNDGHGTPTMRHAHRDDLSGRGLRLIDELSHRWGSHARDGHTVVWFEGDPQTA